MIKDIRQKLHKNYPFMQQSVVRYLSSLIHQNQFYVQKNNQVVFRMTPLLQMLNGPTQDPIEASKRENALFYIHHPIPPLRQERDMKELGLLLDVPSTPLNWKDAFHLMGLAYKYRQYLYCMTQDVSATNHALIIRGAPDELEIRYNNVLLNGKQLSLTRGLPEERLMAMQLFTQYLHCIKTIYTEKQHIINQIVFGPQRMQFLPAKQIARSRRVSRHMTSRHPAEKQIQSLQKTVHIPPHVIKLCHLDDIVGSCPRIPEKTYHKDILPLFVSPMDEDEVDYFQIRRGTNVQKLINDIFPPGKKQCLKYIFHKIYSEEKDQYTHLLEIHIRCKARVQSGNLYTGLFSLRFYNDFVEFTETTINAQNNIIHRMEGIDYFLHYNPDEKDDFLGWDIDVNTPEQYQSLKKQTLLDGSHEFAPRLVHLLERALHTQTTKDENPLTGWEQGEVLIFPSLS